MTPHLNRLVEIVQMWDHNICFYAELTKNIPSYHQILPLIWSSVRYGQTVNTEIILQSVQSDLSQQPMDHKLYICFGHTGKSV